MRSVITLVYATIALSVFSASILRAEAFQSSVATTSEFEQLKRDLQSADPNVRYAAFARAIESKRPEVIELAIEAGFASNDPSMKALAFRAAFASVQVLQVQITVPEGVNESNKRENIDYFLRYKGNIIANIQYDYSTGKFFDSQDSTKRQQGQISGSVITFRNNFCSGQLRNVPKTWEFKGKVSCAYSSASIYDGVFALR